MPIEGLGIVEVGRYVEHVCTWGWMRQRRTGLEEEWNRMQRQCVCMPIDVGVVLGMDVECVGFGYEVYVCGTGCKVRRELEWLCGDGKPNVREYWRGVRGKHMGTGYAVGERERRWRIGWIV